MALKYHITQIEDYIGKYYMNGDTTLKVLSILDTDKGKVIVCLCKSYNHGNFSIEVFKESDFLEWFASNEIEDEIWEIIADDLL